MSTVVTDSIRIASCHLCGGGELETLARRDRHGGPLETVVCRRCGLVSHAELPSEAGIQQYYARYYRREYNKESVPSAYRVVREWRRAGKLLRQLTPFLSPGASVFEVGSGIGCAVKQFELAGHRAAGIEPGEGFQRYSRQQLRADVRLGTLQDLVCRPAHDLVLLVHVLEHLRSPREALERIHGVLRPGGLLYVEVPNFGLPHAAPRRIFHFAHIYNFTDRTLTALAGAAGFELVERLSAPTNRDLMLLFRATGERRLVVDPRGYDVAVSALRRHAFGKYYLRRRYVAQRLRDLSRQLTERLEAQRQLHRILERCAAGSGPLAVGLS